jgi:hypothetical protein
MEPDQDRNCLLCEVVLPEYEDTIIRQERLIKQLQKIIDILNDRDSARHSSSAGSQE